MMIKECFTSFQGEGGSVGAPAVFLRLSHCNLNCTFCDEQNDEALLNLSVNQCAEQIINELKHLPQKNKLLIITGGEPLLQYDELKELINVLNNSIKDINIHMETNGTIKKYLPLNKIVVSPKILTEKQLDETIAYFSEAYSKVEFKFVITIENINYLINYINHNNIKNLYFQPEYNNATIITDAIINKYPLIKKPFKLSVQTHKYLNQK